MAKLRLTAGTVNKLPLRTAGQELFYDTRLRGFGLRVGTTSKVYFAEKRVDGRTVRHTIGEHGPLTADQAEELAKVKLLQLATGHNLNAEAKARGDAAKAAGAAKQAQEKYTLAALCHAYHDYLTAQGKQSASDVGNIFTLYVWGDEQRDPPLEPSEFADVPAADLTDEQAADLISVPWNDGKQRTAGKLRSYLRAAYAVAIGARTDSSKPRQLKGFAIRTNPIASTGSLSEANRVRHVMLTEKELGKTMRLLWQRLDEGYDDALAALALGVMMGGQRPAQTLRIAPADVDVEAWTLTLWDGKGRRQQPRKHVLPIPKAARPLVKKIMENCRSPEWIFGNPEARTVPTTVSSKGGELVREATGRSDVQPRDLRRTCETLLAGMGIHKDLRAQLQSHGLGGVQDRVYDMHDYVAEKLRALDAWNAKLKTLAEAKAAPSNVKALKRA